MNQTTHPFTPCPLINDQQQLGLAIDHIVPSNLEQALLLTNLFEEPSDLLQLGFDRLDDGSIHKSDPNLQSQNFFLSQHEPSAASPWWTIASIGDQVQPSTITNTCSLFSIDHKTESNHDQCHSTLNLAESVKTLSGPEVIDPTLDDHLPLQSTGQNTCNLLDSWIDFTGGASGSTATTGETSSIQLVDPLPTELTDPPAHCGRSLDQSFNLSATPPQPTSVAEGRAAKPKAKKPSKRRISSVSTISSSSITSTSSASSSTSASCSSSSSSFSPSSISGGSRDQKDTNPRKTKTNRRNEFLERNRLAASRSRAKKKSYQRHLEEESQRLESEKVKLNQIIQDLIIEKEKLKVLVNQRFNFTQPHSLESNTDLATCLSNESSSF